MCVIYDGEKLCCKQNIIEGSNLIHPAGGSSVYTMYEVDVGKHW